MSWLVLGYRLMIRPLGAEPVRAALTVLAIALGVAVTLAIDLAGSAAAGSFRSSMETLAGDNDLEVIATGGVPEGVAATIAELPYELRISPRIEDYAIVMGSKRTVPLLGIDGVGESNGRDGANFGVQIEHPEEMVKYLGDYNSVWVGESLKRKAGEMISLIVNDRPHEYVVRGTFPDSDGNAVAVVMDLAAAQRAVNRFGMVDRILIRTPRTEKVGDCQKDRGKAPAPLRNSGQPECGRYNCSESAIAEALPGGVEVRPVGTATNENRKMLGGFRWNLRLLSYIALIVGAFLIYNTISVSVVRRRADIGIVRALGASRGAVLAAFLGEAAAFGLAGGLIGLPLGRLMAGGAVKLMAGTVQALYVSSRPGPLELNAGAVLLALIVGIGVSVASAYAPAREASQVAPVEAMARGRREYETQVHKLRDFTLAIVFAAAALAASKGDAIGGKPLLGYVAALLLIVACALAIPAFVDMVLRFVARPLAKLLGVEALLASRSLAGSLRRTSVLVGALATAIAMMTSVGIMVGSFRQTVLVWMEDQLPADLYISPAGGGPDRHPTISVDLAGAISRLPGVAAIDRLREYEISFDGMPAGLASIEPNVLRSYRNVDFLSGRSTREVLNDLRGKKAVIVTEPFANKHSVRAGESITLPLGGTRDTFRVVDVYYDYSSERGTILMDRDTLLRYLPDPAASNMAVYVAPGASITDVRAEIERAAAGRRILIFTNRDLRQQALQIFDRTFAITYALEAVAVMIAVMGVAGALLALVIDRRREFGLLRFVGAASGQLRKLIVVEAGLLGLLATGAGVALGFALSLILIFVINKQSFGWTIRFHWPVTVLLGALSLVYVGTVLAGLYPANVAVGLKPIEVVHEE